MLAGADYLVFGMSDYYNQWLEMLDDMNHNLLQLSTRIHSLSFRKSSVS